MNREWLKKCIRTAEMLYCAYPYEVLEKLYSKGADDHLDRDDAIRVASENDMEYADGNLGVFLDLGYGDGFFRPALAEDEEYQKYKAMDTPFAAAHLSELEVESIIKEQEACDFYIPTKSEIESISTAGFFENEAYKKLAKLIKDKDYPRTLWQNFCCDAEITDEINRAAFLITTEMKDGLPVMDIDALNKLFNIIMECHKATNKRSRRGWEPEKLFNSKPKGMPKTIVPMSHLAAENMREAEPFFRDQGVTVDYDAGFGDFRKMENGKIKKIKVGRNEPCPCGSGKKYKKCHGRGDAIMTTAGQREYEPQWENDEPAPWDTIVVFGPEEGYPGSFENYYFCGGTDEGVILIGKNKTIQDKIIKVHVELHDDEPNRVIVIDDSLYAMVSAARTMEESDGLFLTVGLYEREQDILIVDLLRKMNE